jgi:hypothetical protein
VGTTRLGCGLTGSMDPAPQIRPYLLDGDDQDEHDDDDDRRCGVVVEEIESDLQFDADSSGSDEPENHRGPRRAPFP